jgi:hypothetical protein
VQPVAFHQSLSQCAGKNAACLKNPANEVPVFAFGLHHSSARGPGRIAGAGGVASPVDEPTTICTGHREKRSILSPFAAKLGTDYYSVWMEKRSDGVFFTPRSIYERDGEESQSAVISIGQRQCRYKLRGGAKLITAIHIKWIRPRSRNQSKNFTLLYDSTGIRFGVAMGFAFLIPGEKLVLTG